MLGAWSFLSGMVLRASPTLPPTPEITAALPQWGQSAGSSVMYCDFQGRAPGFIERGLPSACARRSMTLNSKYKNGEPEQGPWISFFTELYKFCSCPWWFGTNATECHHLMCYLRWEVQFWGAWYFKVSGTYFRKWPSGLKNLNIISLNGCFVRHMYTYINTSSTTYTLLLK